MLPVAKFFKSKDKNVVALFGWKDEQTEVFKKNLSQNLSSSGFTLIELLVTVAIIGILAATSVIA